MDMQPPPRLTADTVPAADRTIGEILRQTRGLDDTQIGRVLERQRARGLRFGEAAVDLGLATHDDVLWALAQQFQYPYAPNGSTRHRELVVAAQPYGEQAEAFRDLRSQLLMGVLAGSPRRALAVVSPDIGDGKTFMAANLAAAFSQLGARTLLLDADLRTPRQHQVFDIQQAFGLSAVLSGRRLPSPATDMGLAGERARVPGSTPEASVVHCVADLPSLYVFPVGAVPPNPLELLQQPAFGLLMHELLRKFDHVIVDTPAAAHGVDARVIAAHCGAALVVGRRNRSRIQSLQSLVDRLAQGPTQLAGVVLNDC